MRKKTRLGHLLVIAAIVAPWGGRARGCGIR